MPPVKSKTVQESRPPMNRNPKKQNSTSCASVKKHGRLEKQASINESDKLVDRNKRPKTECSLEVPVSSARRYSLPTAQIIEEAKENAYLKKAQKYGCNSDSRYSLNYFCIRKRIRVGWGRGVLFFRDATLSPP